MSRRRLAEVLGIVFSLGLTACPPSGIPAYGPLTESLPSSVHLISEAKVGAATHSEYMDLLHRTHPNGVSAHCAVWNGNPLVDGGTDPEDYLVGMSGQACGCVPWGDCVEGLCSCATLCPNDFRIFERHRRDGTVPTEDNSLAFVNSTDAFKNSAHPNPDGYCSGIAALSRDFSYLAFFKGKMDAGDPPVPEPKLLPGGTPNPKWFEFYKQKIDAVLDGKAVDIPGYENMKDFSSDPVIQDYLLKVSAEEWARRAQGWDDDKAPNKPLRREKYEAFINEVRQRKHDNQTAIVDFMMPGVGGHTVEAYDVQSGPDGTKVCIRDPNCSGSVNGMCANFFQLDGKTGRMKYHELCGTVPTVPYDKGVDVGDIGIDPADESDQVKYFHSLRGYCEKGHQCPLTE